MKVALKAITPNAELTIVEIARVSSTRIDKSESPEGLINYLIRNKHWSPFEHGTITFEITTSKSIAIQLLRHVSCRFQEFSQRYAVVENIEDVEFRLQADKNRQSSTDIVGGVKHLADGIFSVWHEVQDHNQTEIEAKRADWLYKVAKNFNDTLNLYKEGIDLGFAKECARFVLPVAAQTTLYMTGNIRSWIHIIEQRVDSHAQKEIQLIAKEMKKIFIENCPIISKSLNW